MTKKRSYFFKSLKAFTLVEIIVVIGIIMLLTTIGTVSYGFVTRRTRNSKRQTDVETIKQALVMYRSDKGHYPQSLESLTLSNYLNPVPTDPHGVNYLYTVSPPNITFSLRATLEPNGTYTVQNP